MASLDEILRAKNKRFERLRGVLKHPRERRGHERFAEANHVTQNDTTSLLQVPRRNPNCRRLKLKQDTAHIGRDGELGSNPRRSRRVGRLQGLP
jgi:hypothetical protein